MHVRVGLVCSIAVVCAGAFSIAWTAANRAPQTAAAGKQATTSAASQSPSSSASQGPPPDAVPSSPTSDSVQGGEIVISEPGRAQAPRLAPFSQLRSLRTVLRRPSIAPGPVPVVVFAHGFNSEPEDYGSLLDAWAAAGYLVAAPELPDSARNLPGEPSRDDISAQAADLSAVVSALLDGRAGPIDPRRIALAGHSDGGTAVATMLLTPGSADPRVSAYLVLSGATPTGATGAYRAPGAVLFAVGAEDENGNLSEAQAMFAMVRGPAALVDAADGDHMSMYVTASPLGDAVRDATVDFLTLALPRGVGPQLSLSRFATSESSYLTAAVRP